MIPNKKRSGRGSAVRGARSATTQPTLPHDLRPAEQTGGDPPLTPHETGADSLKLRGEAGLITDSQHRGD